MNFIRFLFTILIVAFGTNAYAANHNHFQFGHWHVSHNIYKSYSTVTLYSEGTIQKNNFDIKHNGYYFRPQAQFICKNGVINNFNIKYSPLEHIPGKPKSLSSSYRVPYDVEGGTNSEILLKYYRKEGAKLIWADTNNIEDIATTGKSLQSGAGVRFQINEHSSLGETIYFDLSEFESAYRKFKSLCPLT